MSEEAVIADQTEMCIRDMLDIPVFWVVWAISKRGGAKAVRWA